VVAAHVRQAELLIEVEGALGRRGELCGVRQRVAVRIGGGKVYGQRACGMSIRRSERLSSGPVGDCTANCVVAAPTRARRHLHGSFVFRTA